MEASTVAEFAATLADERRVQIALALMDGRALPAGELAQFASVSASTASFHLAKMIERGVLRVEVQGRHRYYRLAGPEVASAIETFGALTFSKRPTGNAPPGLRFARTCYNHLAGILAVELNRAAQTSGLWREAGEKEYEITPKGEEWLGNLGIAVPAR